MFVTVMYRSDRERMQLRAETEELGGELAQLAKAKVRETKTKFILASR